MFCSKNKRNAEQLAPSIEQESSSDANNHRPEQHTNRAQALGPLPTKERKAPIGPRKEEPQVSTSAPIIKPERIERPGGDPL